MKNLVNGEYKDILKIGSKNFNTENWKVFHPNGRHMFVCGENKANWYLDRNLATIIGKNQIKFNFDPKGDGFDDNEIFGKTERIMRCVVSGIEDDLQRHHIVPYCYRCYFPITFKSKNHHDVVLINREYHYEYELQANLYKDEIAQIYNVNTIAEYNREYSVKLRETSKDNSMILNTIHSLFKSYGKITHEKIIEKLKYISIHSEIPFNVLCGYNYIQFYKLYLHLKSVGKKELFEFKNNNRINYDHGYQVVNKLDSDEKIEEFIKLWRNHFINTMQPKYMPEGWSVNFRIKSKIL